MCTYEMRQTRDEVGGRTNTGVRREPLGIDRTGTRYYDFDEKDEDHGLCRVFAQTLVEAPPRSRCHRRLVELRRVYPSYPNS